VTNKPKPYRSCVKSKSVDQQCLYSFLTCTVISCGIRVISSVSLQIVVSLFVCSQLEHIQPHAKVDTRLQVWCALYLPCPLVPTSRVFETSRSGQTVALKDTYSSLHPLPPDRCRLHYIRYFYSQRRALMLDTTPSNSDNHWECLLAYIYTANVNMAPLLSHTSRLVTDSAQYVNQQDFPSSKTVDNCSHLYQLRNNHLEY